MSMWTQSEAIEICRKLETAASAFGGHVALTGGCLYKDGERRDLDIVIYRSADEPAFDWEMFFGYVELAFDIKVQKDFGYCKKAVTVCGRLIDFFDPFRGGEHKSSEDLI